MTKPRACQMIGALAIALAAAACGTGVAQAGFVPEPAPKLEFNPSDDLISGAIVKRDIGPWGTVRTDIGCPSGGRVFDVQLPDDGSALLGTRLKGNVLELQSKLPWSRTAEVAVDCVAPVVFDKAQRVGAPPAAEQRTVLLGSDQVPEITGPDAGDFSVSACTRPPKVANCTITVTFAPRSPGAKSAWLRLRYDTLAGGYDRYHRATDMTGAFGVWRTHPWVDVELSGTAAAA